MEKLSATELSSGGEALRLAKLGNEAATAALLRQFMPLVHARAARYAHRAVERDDLVQEGLIGLFSAVAHYDASLGVPFRHYARTCIDHAMLGLISSATRKKHMILSDSSEIDEDLGDNTPSPPDIVERRVELEQLRDRLGVLSKSERETLYLFLDGHSYERIAEIRRVDLKSVDNALQRVRRKLRA